MTESEAELQFKVGELQARLEESDREVATLRAKLGGNHGRCANSLCKKCYGSVVVASLGDGMPRRCCCFCQEVFTELAPGIQTIHVSRGYVSLCEVCYANAGNDVR